MENENDFDTWLHENTDSLREFYEEQMFDLEQMGLEDEKIDFYDWALQRYEKLKEQGDL